MHAGVAVDSFRTARLCLSVLILFVKRDKIMIDQAFKYCLNHFKKRSKKQLRLYETEPGTLRSAAEIELQLLEEFETCYLFARLLKAHSTSLNSPI